jgi:hypothetical protein
MVTEIDVQNFERIYTTIFLMFYENVW